MTLESHQSFEKRSLRAVSGMLGPCGILGKGAMVWWLHGPAIMRSLPLYRKLLGSRRQSWAYSLGKPVFFLPFSSECDYPSLSPVPVGPSWKTDANSINRVKLTCGPEGSWMPTGTKQELNIGIIWV